MSCPAWVRSRWRRARSSWSASRPGPCPNLLTTEWQVSSDTNRVAVRLDGERLERSTTEELPSEAMVRGAVQVPSSGQPLIFGPDHPVTGGYPVIAVLTDQDADHAGQL